MNLFVKISLSKDERFYFVKLIFTRAWVVRRYLVIISVHRLSLLYRVLNSTS